MRLFTNLTGLLWCVVMAAAPGQGVAQTEQMPLRYAHGFQVAYFDGHKVVTVTTSGEGEAESHRYVLVPKGHATPPGFTDDQKVEIPIERLITTSTTYLPHLAALGVVGSLVGVDDIQYVNTPAVNNRYQAGQIAEVGHGATIDLERILSLNADLVMTMAAGLGQVNAYPTLKGAGVPVVINGAYAEPSLLGRTEWIKFIAAFYDKEAAAAALFDAIVAQYQAFTDLVKNLPKEKRPTVYGGSLWRGTWYVSGGKTYSAELIKDAGGAYVWADDDSRQSLSLDFEAVYDRAHGADFWLPMRNEWHSLGDVINTDERYGGLAAFQSGSVYNANARLNTNGGNDYWETGLVEPHVILADLIHIFHPGVLPNHLLKYYKKLE
ncbi:MAG: ABC transporter substrate-binding protein [bacterium]|nr:ABC transporter substrate-binding protein [bacterium]